MNELTINADDRFILFLPRPYDSQRAVVFGRVCLFVCLIVCSQDHGKQLALSSCDFHNRYSNNTGIMAQIEQKSTSLRQKTAKN